MLPVTNIPVTCYSGGIFFVEKMGFVDSIWSTWTQGPWARVIHPSASSFSIIHCEVSIFLLANALTLCYCRSVEVCMEKKGNAACGLLIEFILQKFVLCTKKWSILNALGSCTPCFLSLLCHIM